MPSSRRLSPSALSNHLGCSHATVFDRACDDERIARPTGHDPTRELRVARGHRHEASYVESLRAAGLVVEDLNGKTIEATRDAMARGVDVIVQAALAHVDAAGEWNGRADVLLRVDVPHGIAAPSWGPWCYEVHDTKLANETRGGTLLQLALYSEWLAALQGVRPQHFSVVMPGDPFRIEPYRLSDVDAYTRWALAGFTTAIANEPTAEQIAAAPDPRPHCEICRWWLDCEKRRRDVDHLSLVAGLGRAQIRVLRDAGITTLEAFATGLDRVPKRPEHGAFESYERLHHQARVQLQARLAGEPKHELLTTKDEEGLGELPAPRPGDLFLDFEGCPFVEPSGREYLFGIAYVDEHGKEQYEHRWAWTAADELVAFGWLLDLIRGRLEADPQMHVFHFGAYEGTALRQLGSRWGSRMDDVDELLRGRVLVDLHAIVRRTLRAGVESYSIKFLEPHYGLRRAAELPEAKTMLRRVEAALELGVDVASLGNETIELVRVYNRDDCVSVRALRDWLESLRRGREQELGRALPRPSKPSAEASEKVDQRNAAIAELTAQLRADVPEDPGARTAHDAARWLLADLLSYHRREKAASWWDYYRLAELDEDDAAEDREALTGLSFDSERPDGRSTIHRYRFSRQDVAIRVGDDIHVQNPRGAERLARRLATVFAIDRSEGWIDLRAGAKLWPPGTPHPGVIFRHRDFPSDVKAFALQAFARWVLQRGDDTWAAAWELLTRAAPRLRGGAFAADDPDTIALARRVVVDLSRTVLPIQGPPGTGKTHTGAEMILHAWSSGLRVGVTAGSHAAIRNLLEKVVETARRLGVAPKLAHRTETEDEDPLDGIENLDDSKAAIVALQERELDILGATTFLWSREDAKDTLDILFVDEAGQLSLADTLAVAGAAKSLVLLGDPQQLQQPCKATHPEGADVSALRHLLGEANTIASDRGIFLGTTWRLPPRIREFTSHVFYDGRLDGRTDLDQCELLGPTRFAGHGIWRVAVLHDGCSVRSLPEVDEIERIIRDLLAEGRTSWRDMNGIVAPLVPADILVVAPYNAQVDELALRLRPLGVDKVGTVDRFQGQQAPVVLWSMTSSTPDDAPRGLGFLYDGFRLNVATSRAKVACIVVGSPRVFDVDCRTAADVRLVNRWCALAEHCERPATGM